MGFVQNGATVYISSRTASACDAAAAELTALGPGRCVSLPADLASYDECQRVKAEIERREGILHVLVNNSGRSYEAPLASHSDQAWDDLMTLNVRRVFTLVQALTPLLEAGAGGGTGRVINVSYPPSSG
jgi:NAD(P)-dependent dehydrogenase (short-subunit alcohol dehydrogenase family)